MSQSNLPQIDEDGIEDPGYLDPRFSEMDSTAFNEVIDEEEFPRKSTIARGSEIARQTEKQFENCTGISEKKSTSPASQQNTQKKILSNFLNLVSGEEQSKKRSEESEQISSRDDSIISKSLERVLCEAISSKSPETDQSTREPVTKEDYKNLISHSVPTATPPDPISEPPKVNYYQLCCELNQENVELQQKISALSANFPSSPYAPFDCFQGIPSFIPPYSPFSSPSTSYKPRTRRPPHELNKSFQCPFPSCGRNYSSDTSLKFHLKKKHPELYFNPTYQAGYSMMGQENMFYQQ